MKSRIFVLVGLIVLLFIAVTLTGSIRNILGVPTAETPNIPLVDEPVACTMDAKMCPDGSYVGRQGPHCEFAACPVGDPVLATTTIQTSINKTVTIGSVSITPIEVLEDSRCPRDVVCIQAGTVRLRTNINTSNVPVEQNFTLGQSVTIGSYNIELVSVIPGTVSIVQIKKEDYKFTFKIIKK